MLPSPREPQTLSWLVLDNFNIQAGQSWVTSFVTVAGLGKPQTPFGPVPNKLSLVLDNLEHHFGQPWKTPTAIQLYPQYYYTLVWKILSFLQRGTLFLLLQPDIFFFPQGLKNFNPKSGQFLPPFHIEQVFGFLSPRKLQFPFWLLFWSPESSWLR